MGGRSSLVLMVDHPRIRSAISWPAARGWMSCP